MHGYTTAQSCDGKAGIYANRFTEIFMSVSGQYMEGDIQITQVASTPRWLEKSFGSCSKLF
jgi:hypothetical protein